MNKILFILVTFSILASTNCGKVKGDPEILDQINKVVANCEVDTRYTFLKNCKENADKDLEKMIADKGPAASLPSLALALNNEDIKVAATSASMLYSKIKDNMSKVNDAPDSVDNKVLPLFIKGLEKYKSEYFTFYAVRSVMHLAMIKGDKSVIEFFKTHPEKAIQFESLSYLMQFGRLKLFDEVKALANDKDLVKIALNNPRNMYKYTEDETKAVCDWTVGFLENEDSSIAGKAAIAVSTRCKGEYLDKLLDKLEALAKDGKLDGEFKSSITNFTFSCDSFMGSQPTGTPEQCERKEKLKAK